MTVIITGTGETKQAQLVVAQTELTALAALAPSPSNQQLLKARAEDLVNGCMDCQRLQAAAIIAQFTSVFTASWLAANAPTIAVLQTNLTANGPNGATLLRSAQERAVNTAVAQGKLSAYTDILSVMT